MIGLRRISSHYPRKTSKLNRLVHTVVLLRHGESLWNHEERFTGWSDVPLTAVGEADARDAGMIIGERKIKFDVAFTSNLERAWRTCAIALATSNQSGVEVVRSWRLNERHYGALQGHEKSSTKLIQTFGEDKVLEWRRSYTATPPSLYNLDFLKQMGPGSLETCTSWMNPKYLNRNRYFDCRRLLKAEQQPVSGKFLNELGESDIFPTGESLKQCQERAFHFWQNVIGPRVKAGEKALIVAHANTIRALVKAVDNISDDRIWHLRIPNGIPLVYHLDDNLKPIENLSDDLGFQANYLVSARNHPKMIAYERCVRKKMRSLFEYLDTDHDGKITQQCLLQGLNRLKSLELTAADDNSDSCEYEINELIRAVPDAGTDGGVTLQKFIEAESILLPGLTKLRLL